jgi:hypothetical protein
MHSTHIIARCQEKNYINLRASDIFPGDHLHETSFIAVAPLRSKEGEEEKDAVS